MRHRTTVVQVRKPRQEARGEKRPCVIVVETEKHRYLPGGGVWWDVAVAEVSNVPETQRLRAEYEQDRQRRQRFHY
jgi:3D-(3,5/4)-trihydroxycyclohexane-1,2-dione acylhydrolase (decyclizing)